MLHRVWLIYTPSDRKALAFFFFTNLLKGDVYVEALNEDTSVFEASSGHLGDHFD